ncbi:MAG: SusC/RagA family TonB-linked outer membrane protein [Cyclobacteriaceae bacterium]|nr:SusC/RagA family TonB-linked outer membrane protein [Cyclobacteriaceae bacterium]
MVQISGNKYGFFPSGAFAWKVIDEAFMENISTISNLKLRVSYGQTGSQAINAYNALSQAGGPAGWKLTSVDGRNPTTALYQTAMGNQDLKWETTTQTDIGIDLGLFENRLNITADYYYKKTSDLLFNKRYPNIADNDNQIIENVGSMENEGIDLNISAVISDRNGFRWDAMVNFSWVRNEILDLGTDANGAEVPFLVLSPVNERAGVKDENSFWRITQVGKPLGAFYVPIFDGIVSTEEQRANHPYFVSDAGSAVYKDVNGDGRINQNDRVIYGQAAPDFVGGITNNFSYKGIDLNIFFDYSIGNKVMNMTNYVLTRGGGQYNITKEYYDSYWREDVNTASAKYPRADRSILLSSHYVEDGSFLRLRNVTLGYTLPESVLESLNIRKLRLYATASNLLMITKYSGMSPDVNVDITNNLGQGLDYSAYPASRLVMLGINITL